MSFSWLGEKELATDDIPFFDGIEYFGHSYSEVKDVWKAHYSRCIENQLDVVHVPFVHHNTIGRGNKTVVNGPALVTTENFIKIFPYNSVDNGQLPIDAKYCPTNADMNLAFVFPNLWQNTIHENLKVIIFFAPVSKSRTVFYIRFYSNLFKFKPFNIMLAQIGKVVNRIVERQDKPIVETQKPKISELSCGENLIKGDSPIIAYRRIRQKLKS